MLHKLSRSIKFILSAVIICIFVFVPSNVFADEITAASEPTIDIAEGTIITLIPGEEYHIPFTTGENYELDVMEAEFSSDASGLSFSENGLISSDTGITEKINVWVYVTAVFKNKVTEQDQADNTVTIKRFFKISVIPLDLEESFKPIAKGLTREVTLSEYTNTQITYEIGDSSIVSLENGILTALSSGETTITIKKKNDTDEFTQTYTIVVTDPAFTRKKDAIAEYGSVSIRNLLSGISDSSEITDLVSSKPKKIQVSGDTISGLKKGTSIVISCTVDGRPIKATFRVTRPYPKGSIKVKESGSNYYYYTNKPVIVQKGKKATFKASGMSSVSHISYAMASQSIATVSESGVVKGKKYGSTHFIATIDYRDYYITTVVAKKKAVQVLKKAYTALGKNYSMARRMDKNYYDCSSLVWRCYSPYGVTFGYTTWAPTADMEAYYMYTHKKMKYHKAVSYKKLKPGDIVFFGPSSKGNYGDIYHVAIYVGDDTIIHAAGTAYGVIQSNYTSRMKNVSCIARPF